jgi:hypothetical protein
MIPALRSEFKKLLSVRSTYVLSLFFLLLISFLAFYVDGFKNVPTETTSALDHARASLFVAGNITQIANVISVAGGYLLASGKCYRHWAAVRWRCCRRTHFDSPGYKLPDIPGQVRIPS